MKFSLAIFSICLFYVFGLSKPTDKTECNSVIDSIIEKEKIRLENEWKDIYLIVKDEMYARNEKLLQGIDSILKYIATGDIQNMQGIDSILEDDSLKYKKNPAVDSILKKNREWFVIGGGCLNSDTAFIMLEPFSLIEFGTVSDKGFKVDRVVAPLLDFRTEKTKEDFIGTSSLGIYKGTKGEPLWLCKSSIEERYLLMTKYGILNIDFVHKKKIMAFDYALYNWYIDSLHFDSRHIVQPFKAKKIHCKENGFVIEFYDWSSKGDVESDFFIEKNGDTINGKIPEEACFELKDSQNPKKHWKMGNCRKDRWFIE